MALEQQMLEAVEYAHYKFGEAIGGSEDSFITEEVTKIALRLIEKAWYDGRDSVDRDGDQKWYYQDFKKELL